MSELLGVTWVQAAATVLATVAMYLTFLVCVRVFGQRRIAAMSAVELGSVMALGAVVGRTSLLLRPTLAAGVLVTVTLFAMQALLTTLRRRHRIDRVLSPSPVLLVACGGLIPGALRSSGVSEADVRQRLRLAGVHSLAEVEAVVLETNGAVSVVRHGVDVEPWLFADVPGAELVIRARDEGGGAPD